MTDRLHLPQRYRRILEALLREHVPDAEVWAYGSRITGESHEGSDLDLVARGPELKPLGDGFFELLEAIESSNIPILVQAHDWARLPESFHREIERNYVVLQEGTKDTNQGVWREVRIGQIAEVIGGSTPSTKESKNFDGDIPWLTPKDLAGTHDRYIEHGSRNLSRKGLESCSAKLLPRGAVLLSTRAPIGYVAIAKNPLATNQGFRSLVLRDDCIPEYIYYWLVANTKELELNASGTTFLELSGSALKEIRLSVPDTETQRDIAHVLGTFDDKIELNRRTNETLEEMARTLFKSWFVDFLPVRAKQRTRTQTGDPVRAKAALRTPSAGESDWTVERARAYLESMDKNVVDLFPDRLVESELGEIPEGWEVKALGDVVDVLGGTTPSTKVSEYWRGGTHCWATPKDLSELSSPVLLDTERKITESGLARIGSGLLPKGSVLLSSRAPIGYLAIAETPVAINQGFIGIPPSETVSNLFLLNWCSTFHEVIVNHANGSTFLEISKKDFRHIPIVWPSEAVMAAFDDHVRGIYGRIVSNERESRKLTAQRNALLPKLVSGYVQIK